MAEQSFSEAQLLNLAYFERIKDELIHNDLHKGKFVVIYGESVKGFFDTMENALKFAIGQFPRDEIIIQQVVDENSIVSFLACVG